MFSSMGGALRQIVTGPDNVTHDVVRWLAVLGVLAGIVYAGWDVVVLKNHFDFNSYGIGLGATLGALGLALKWKPEPEPKE